ncbi:MAG: Dimethylglycine dehydrogenase [Anaerosporomusa subterranea]|nr:Dimethylglycine dehydrogenase [Anaerosporomusa subterranea]
MNIARTQPGEVVIIGAGVIGSAIAYYLVKHGIRPLLLDQGDVCSGSSGACDKAISMQSKNPGLHLSMAMESAAMFPGLGEELDDDIDYLPVDLLSIEEARQRQPALSPSLLASTYSPADAEVSPLKLTFGFARAARKLGAIIHTGAKVTDIESSGGRVSGVVTSKGAFRADIIINAAGAYAPFIGRLVSLEIPIKPRRGQIIVTEAMPPTIFGTLWSARYIVAKHTPDLIRQEDPQAAELGVGLSLGQTQEGTLLIGGTRELVGYDSSTTPEALSTILRHAVNIVPGLKNIHIIRVFSGLRPYTPDGMPILGPTELAGFLMAAGHEGDGIALAPLTGKMMANYVAGGIESLAIQKLHLERFVQ